MNTSHTHFCYKENELNEVITRVNRIENTMFGYNGHNGLAGRLIRLESSVSGVNAMLDKLISGAVGGIIVSVVGTIASKVLGI